LSRFIFSAEMIGGILFLIWLIRSKHLPTIGGNTTKRFAGAIRGATQFGLIVFSATLLVVACKNKRYMFKFLNESNGGQDFAQRRRDGGAE
jgi:membrane protein implicated in regulation of membrane protease activity